MKDYLRNISDEELRARGFSREELLSDYDRENMYDEDDDSNFERMLLDPKY